MFKIFKIKVKSKRVGLLSISYHSGKHNRKNKKYFSRNNAIQEIEKIKAKFLRKLQACLGQHDKHFEHLLQ